MMPSRVWPTIDAVVSILTAAGVHVWDGPVVTGDFSDAVFVGYDGDPEGGFSAASLDQEWAGSVGTRARDERFDVQCAVVALSGDESWSPARARAKALMDAVETALKADPSLGQVPSPFVAGVRPTGLFQEPTDAGNQVRVPFVVSVQTRV